MPSMGHSKLENKLERAKMTLTKRIALGGIMDRTKLNSFMTISMTRRTIGKGVIINTDAVLEKY